MRLCPWARGGSGSLDRARLEGPVSAESGDVQSEVLDSGSNKNARTDPDWKLVYGTAQLADRPVLMLIFEAWLMINAVNDPPAPNIR